MNTVLLYSRFCISGVGRLDDASDVILKIVKMSHGLFFAGKKLSGCLFVVENG